MRIQAVAFDAGGTLIEPSPSVGAVYAEVAGRFGMTGLDATRLDRQFERAWRARRNFDYSKQAWWELVQATFGALAGDLPKDYFSALYDRFAEADAWRVFDDVVPALETLASRDMFLLVISNWDPRLHPLLDRLKLRKYFEAIVISSEAGFAKPSPVIFEQALRHLGLPAGAVVHVGDSVEEDVEGARAAGLNAIWLDRRGLGGAGSMRALTDLESWLDGRTRLRDKPV
jgi:putative hydrolase of the HAD superfamily